MSEHQRELLLQAAEAAVQEFQAGRAAPGVEDILHLEKRFNQLPGASSGSVALEDAVQLLGAEVLADEPLEVVTRWVLAGGGAQAAPPAVLSKRQFLSLAHVAELAQRVAFDLVTAEDALRPQEPLAAAKKRPPAIRETDMDTWRIAAAPDQQQQPEEGGEEGTGAPYDSSAAAALAAGAPGPLQAGAGLSRATSLTLAAGPLQQGAAVLSRQNSGCADEAEGEEGSLAAAAVAAALAHRQPHLPSGATSYQSAVELHSDAEDEGAAAEEGGEAAGAVQEFNAKLSGLVHCVSGGAVGAPADTCPPTPEGLLPDEHAVVVAPATTTSAGQARGSWESFGSTPPGSQQQQQQAAAAALAAGLAATPQMAGQPPVNEAVVAAAMAAGMTFMQHLQAAGAAGGAQPSPFADINPLRAAAAAAAAAAASNPAISLGPALSGAAAASPEVRPAGSGGSVAAGTAAPQQLIAEMVARMNLSEDATPEQLEAAAAQLHQQALAKQQQQQQPAAQPATSLQGSVGSAGDAGLRKSWHAFEDAPQYRQAAAAESSGRENQQPRQPAAAGSPSKQPSRLGPQGSGAVARLAPPPVQGIAGWSAMSREDVVRCEGIFTKKGYPAIGGMERHSAMEYFAKLHMQPQIFHQAWQAADLGGDGRLGKREFCLFVQLLRGAQKGWPLPARLAEAEAAALLGEAPMPEAAPDSGRAAGPPMHIDSARMRAALAGGHSRQASMEHAQSVIQDDSDGASSIDSGISESVSGMSVSSRPALRGAVGASPYALGRPSVQPHARTGLGSVLGGGGGAAAVAGAYHPAAPGSLRLPAPAPADAAHSLLELAVHSAQIRYRKPLSTPIFTVSVRDSLGRLVELPIDTHPGHYRRETNTIHSSAIVRLASQLRSIPPGATLFLEIKHWKSEKRRFSTLAWSYAPLDRLVDFGQHAARVRSGPVDLPLLKKPVDLTLRKARRLSSRGMDLHLSLRGVE